MAFPKNTNKELCAILYVTLSSLLKISFDREQSVLFICRNDVIKLCLNLLYIKHYTENLNRERFICGSSGYYFLSLPTKDWLYVI